MEPVEQPVGLNMHVAMVSSASALDEVVVVGYGTQKKVTLSGAVSSISNKEILTTKGPSLAVALAGKVPVCESVRPAVCRAVSPPTSTSAAWAPR